MKTLGCYFHKNEDFFSQFNNKYIVVRNVCVYLYTMTPGNVHYVRNASTLDPYVLVYVHSPVALLKAARRNGLTESRQQVSLP